MISVTSFYPILYLLNKQSNSSKLGTRMFDQMMVYAIMALTFAHFMCELQTFRDWCFIPLESWHKLLNVFLLIEQCSLVLYLGGLSKEVENTLFGINLILILITQEKDSSTGEIKYSIIPLVVNNLYLFLTNLNSLATK